MQSPASKTRQQIKRLYDEQFRSELPDFDLPAVMRRAETRQHRRRVRGAVATGVLSAAAASTLIVALMHGLPSPDRAATPSAATFTYNQHGTEVSVLSDGHAIATVTMSGLGSTGADEATGAGATAAEPSVVITLTSTTAFSSSPSDFVGLDLAAYPSGSAQKGSLGGEQTQEGKTVTWSAPVKDVDRVYWVPAAGRSVAGVWDVGQTNGQTRVSPASPGEPVVHYLLRDGKVMEIQGREVLRTTTLQQCRQSTTIPDCRE